MPDRIIAVLLRTSDPGTPYRLVTSDLSAASEWLLRGVRRIEQHNYPRHSREIGRYGYLDARLQLQRVPVIELRHLGMEPAPTRYDREVEPILDWTRPEVILPDGASRHDRIGAVGPEDSPPPVTARVVEREVWGEGECPFA